MLVANPVFLSSVRDSGIMFQTERLKCSSFSKQNSTCNTNAQILSYISDKYASPHHCTWPINVVLERRRSTASFYRALNPEINGMPP